MIEVHVSSGTDADRKTRLLTALVEALDGAGTDPNDIMVFFEEIDRGNSSFGGGQPAPLVAIDTDRFAPAVMHHGRSEDHVPFIETCGANLCSLPYGKRDGV